MHQIWYEEVSQWDPLMFVPNFMKIKRGQDFLLLIWHGITLVQFFPLCSLVKKHLPCHTVCLLATCVYFIKCLPVAFCRPSVH